MPTERPPAPPRGAPQRPTDPHGARVRCAWWAAALGAGFLGLLAAVLAAGGTPPLLPLDRRLDGTLHGFALAHPGWTQLNLSLTTWVWGPATMRLLSFAAAAALLRRRAHRQAAWVVTATVVAWALELAVKAGVDRPRPRWPHPVDAVTNAAFPSGHAMAAATACVTLVWLLRLRGVRDGRWATAAAAGVLTVVGVGFTRLYLGVHWPSDVLGGWLAGAAVVAATAAAFAPWQSAEAD